MDFRLTPEQEMIRDAAATFLAEQSGSAAVRAAHGHDAGLWRAMREDLGWCGIAVPAELGGMGLGQVERALLNEQMGRRLAAVPYLASACLATDALLHAATPAAQQRYLPALADGTLDAALALPAPAGWEPDQCSVSASRCGAGYRLSGQVAQVPGAAQAALLLVPARLDWQSGAFGLFALDADSDGIAVTALATLDATRPIARLDLREASGERIDPHDDPARVDAGLRRAVRLAMLAQAAEQVGAASQCLDLTLDYVSQRSQFGRPIASFQAVKHRCAQMLVMLEAARSALYGALRSQPDDAEPFEAAAAKDAANRALFFCAQEAIQLHGGAGFTWEYDPQLYFKRAQAARSWLGDDAGCAALLEAPAPQARADAADAGLRDKVAAWMQLHLQGKYAPLRHRGGPGDEDAFPAERKEWEAVLAAGGWTCVGWPRAAGGRALSAPQQLIVHEEYARAGGPGRMGHIGEGLIGPTLIAHGSADQQARFLPGIRNGTTFWCQGYSEPQAGSDLANVQTRATQDASGDWLVHGQKVWTSLAHESDWIFVLARCEPGSRGRHGLIFLLMPLDQAGVTVRPIRQISGSAEFNEVFFDGARASAADVVGAPGDGWRVAMDLLGAERGMSTLGQQMHFRHELELVAAAAHAGGALRDPALRRRIGQARAGLHVMRYNALRMLFGAPGQVELVYKYYWSNWHRELGQLAMDVLGADGNLVDPDDARRTRLQGLFLFSRADTIYAGTNEIQLNIIAERGLGMPREARGDAG